jgi:hypothetical protein
MIIAVTNHSTAKFMSTFSFDEWTVVLLAALLRKGEGRPPTRAFVNRFTILEKRANSFSYGRKGPVVKC